MMDSALLLRFYSLRQDSLEFDLKSHRMGTALMGDKKFTVAGEQTIVKRHMVIVVVAMKGYIKLVQEETILLFCIAFCLFSLSDHSIVHVQSPFRIGK